MVTMVDLSSQKKQQNWIWVQKNYSFLSTALALFHIVSNDQLKCMRSMGKKNRQEKQFFVCTVHGDAFLVVVVVV